MSVPSRRVTAIPRISQGEGDVMGAGGWEYVTAYKGSVGGREFMGEEPSHVGIFGFSGD
jgi:hypothetical protein